MSRAEKFIDQILNEAGTVKYREIPLIKKGTSWEIANTGNIYTSLQAAKNVLDIMYKKWEKSPKKYDDKYFPSWLSNHENEIDELEHHA